VRHRTLVKEIALIALSPTPAGFCLSAIAFSATADAHLCHLWSKKNWQKKPPRFSRAAFDLEY
jgi:hypothetical protein